MKLAIISSDNLIISNIGDFIPADTSEIVLGRESAVCSCAAEYAKQKGIALTELLPMYSVYGKKATANRNDFISQYADQALIFWDGRSRWTKRACQLFEDLGKKVTVVVCNEKI